MVLLVVMAGNVVMSSDSTIAYLSLQATREGQASFAHVHEIIKGLQKRGWCVDLHQPSYATSFEKPSFFQRIRGILSAQIKLWMSSKPNIVYIRHHFAAWPTALVLKLRGVRVVQEVNGPYEDLFIAWPWTRKFARLIVWFMKSQLRWADAVVVVTPELAKWVREEGAKRVFVIPNGADTELFHPEAQLDPALEINCPYVVFFGNLAPWQGVDTLLAAVHYPAWPRELSLVIVGDGFERSRVEQSIEKNVLITYLGPQPYTRIPGIVANAIAGMIPKTDPAGRFSETGLYPLKLFETLACGVPAVVTDFPGMADLVREGECGLVIPPDDPGALARAVNYLYRHPEERSSMGKKGRMLVEQEHSWDKRAEQTDLILREILGSKNVGR